MGLGNSKKKYLSNDEIDKYSANNKSLEKYYNHFKNYDGYISLKDFEYCFNRRIDKKIIKILFKIFASEKDKMLLNDLKYFYCMFQVNNISLKLNFIAQLIFNNKNSKNYPKYVDRINLLFEKFTPLRDLLLSTEFIVKISDISKGVPTKVHKELFIKIFENLFAQFLIDFQFLKSNYVSSMNPYIRGAKNISVCDCYVMPNCNNNKQDKNMYDFLYDKMEVEFKRIEKLNDGVFHISLFEKILYEVGINLNIVNLIIVYIKRKIQRNFIDFKSFKQFLLSFTCENELKIKFLFEILSFPNENIDKRFFISIMNNIFEFKLDDNTKKQINSFFLSYDKISLPVFLSFVKENSFMYEILNNLDRVNYIPYLNFKLRPDDKNIEKKCIELILKGEKDLKKYIEKNLSNEPTEEDYFCVDKTFWEKWCDFVEWDVLNIQKEDSVYVKEKHLTSSENNYVLRPKIKTDNLIEGYSTNLKKELVYFKDFIILSKKIFDLFTRWYISNGVEIKFKRIKYPVDDFNALENETPQIYKIEKNTVYEIEINPIFSKFFSFEEILTNIKSPKPELANDLLSTLSENKTLNMSRLVVYSRKVTFREVKNNIEAFYKIINANTRLWLYDKNKKLYLVDLEKSLEEGKINANCLFVLDIIKNNQWISDIIYNKEEKEKETKKEDREEGILRKNSTNHRIIGFHNIGNTCYMNSTLQVLLNLKELSDIFMSKNSKFLVNYKNKFGYNGKIFKEFHKLFQEKLSNEMIDDGVPIQPTVFKEIIGEINHQFRNFDQQDAQEFINFLLDVLHEEMNIKDTKEYIPNPENFDHKEEELANEYWSNNLRRNASFIHSLFLGQLNSNLICENCQSKKITYETFTNLNLPITQKRTINLQIILHRLPFVMKAYYDQYQDNHTLEYQNLKYDYGSNCSNGNIGNMLKMVKKYSYESFQEEVGEVYECDLINDDDIFNKNSTSEIDSKIHSFTNDLKLKSKSHLTQSVYASRLSTSIPLRIILEVECKSKLEKIIESLKKIKELELELENNKDNTMSLTSYAISSLYEPYFYDLDLKIDECFQNDQTINVYELINTNGLNKLLDNKYVDYFLPENKLNEETNGFEEDKFTLRLSYETLSYFNKPILLENLLLNFKGKINKL